MIMSDVVERLLELPDLERIDKDTLFKLCGEAAEKIEQLRAKKETTIGLSSMLGHKCIVRTCDAGVWYGNILQKSGNEVIIGDARRLWRWWAAKSISLSGVANYGVISSKSKIAPAVKNVWLEAIEIIPATEDAIRSIEGCPDAEAE